MELTLEQRAKSLALLLLVGEFSVTFIYMTIHCFAQPSLSVCCHGGTPAATFCGCGGPERTCLC